MTIEQDRHEEPLAACELADVMQVVMRVGVLMLRSGTVSFRVEQAMNRVALKLGADRLDAYVTPTGITASAHSGTQHYTQVARIKRIGVDMNRLSAVESFSHSLVPTNNVKTLLAVLDTIEQKPSLYSLPVIISTVAIACGAFAVLSGGDITEGVAATLSAGVGQIARSHLARKYLNPIALTVICAATSTLVCDLILRGFNHLGATAQLPQSAFSASVLFLVPGMFLVTAALDWVRLDLISAIVRTVYALIVLISVAFGILITVTLTGAVIL